MKSIVIVDYGVGNLWSLKRAFLHCGVAPVISEDATEITSAGALVLPGVGSFEAGMRGLGVRGLISAIKDFGQTGKPMLGICLGAQIMLSRGYEFGAHEGLGLIGGEVVLLSPCSEKIPHIGWNSVSEGTRSYAVYFVHSYILQPDNQADVFGVTEYGGRTFCSVMKRGRIFGVQFHPEKSGPEGLKIIQQFISLVS